MRILVCDDHKAVCDELVQLLMNYAQGKAITIEVDSFNSGIEAYCSLCRTEYDLVFLDIILKDLDGVQLGKRIRELHRDYFTQIIYFSSNNGYAMDLFRIRPFEFLIKPISQMTLFDVLDRFREIQERMNIFFRYQKGGEYINVR